MISNASIQAAWITKLKANTAITALVPAVEIREESWKGTIFTYPNIRVKLGDLTPQNKNKNCQVFNSTVSILVFVEEKSSKQADTIAGVIATAFWGETFTSNGVRFAGITLDSVAPAEVPESDVNSWMSSTNFSTTVQNG